MNRDWMVTGGWTSHATGQSTQMYRECSLLDTVTFEQSTFRTL